MQLSIIQELPRVHIVDNKIIKIEEATLTRITTIAVCDDETTEIPFHSPLRARKKHPPSRHVVSSFPSV